LSKTDVDEAFEWFVIIIGIVTGIMSGFPEYFWNAPPYDIPPSMKAAKAVVVPLLLTLAIWLIGRLSARQYQPIAKVIAWIYVSSLTLGYCQSFFMGIGWIPSSSTTVGLGMIFGFAPLLLVYKFIIPKYRDSYPESQFLKSKIKLLIVFIIAVLIYILMVVVISR